MHNHRDKLRHLTIVPCNFTSLTERSRLRNFRRASDIRPPEPRKRLRNGNSPELRISMTCSAYRQIYFTDFMSKRSYSIPGIYIFDDQYIVFANTRHFAREFAFLCSIITTMIADKIVTCHSVFCFLKLISTFNFFISLVILF